MNARPLFPAVQTAIVPAAGLGTRLYPLTIGVAKELLPLGRYPAIVATLLEAVAAGVRELVVVVSPEKDGLRRFLARFELPGPNRMRIRVVAQKVPVGVLDAIECGYADAALPCAVLFPDLVHLPNQTALQRLAVAHAACGAAVYGLRIAGPNEPVQSTLAVELAEPLTEPAARSLARESGHPLRIARVRKLGVGGARPGELLTTFGQIETPKLREAISTHCRLRPDAPLEDAHLLAALDALGAEGGLYGVLLPGEVLDLGSLPGYLEALSRFLDGTARLRELS